MDEKSIKMLNNEYIEYLNSKDIYDLTFEEMKLIKDPKKRSELRKMIERYFVIINALSSRMKENFSFSLPEEKMSIRKIINEQFQYFYDKGYSKEDILLLINDEDRTKKH